MELISHVRVLSSGFNMTDVLVIVGASMGFGKELLFAMLSNPALVSRHTACIIALITRREKEAMTAWNETYKSVYGISFAEDRLSLINVSIVHMDLSSVNVSAGFTRMQESISCKLHAKIRRFYLFMNSGSVTPVGHLIPSPESVLLTSITANDLAVFDAQLLEHCVLNFTSFVSLLRALILFGLSKRCIQGRQIIRVVNVSSLAAIRELNGLSIYGAIKAARESILRSLSLELNANYPDVDSKFLNYAPGPMQTELVRRDLLGVDSPDNAVKSGAMRFVEPRQSAMICIDLLINAAPTNSWENGAHVDYFDIALD